MINNNNNVLQNLISLLPQNNTFYDNYMPLIAQNPINQITFLQKKRFLENPNFNNNQIFLQENNNFNYLDTRNFQLNEYQGFYRPQLGFYSQFIKPSFIYNNNSNLNETELNYYLLNNLNQVYKENKIENNFNNYHINNVKFNLNNDFLLNNFNYYNYYNQKENINNNINNNINIDKTNFIINDNINSTDSSSSHPQNKTLLKKKISFNVIHTKDKKDKKDKNDKKKVIKKIIKQTENNNEIKVLKNNKVVYVNTFLLNSYSTSKNIKKLSKVAFVGRNKRSSRYRGVSKNGNQWQVLMMIKKNKSYIGSYPSEELAARIYDVLALKNRGVKARTNFQYTSKQIENICKAEIDIKAKNIYEIISQFII